MATETGEYRFTVKESSEGRLSIVFEPAGSTVRQIEEGSFFLDLRPGTTLEAAEAVAKRLNGLVITVGYTE